MTMVTPMRALRVIGAFALFALTAMLISPLVGAEKIDAGHALAAWLGGARGSSSIDIDILIQLRLPRIMLAFMAGSALAVVGAVFQALLRNPLATPYTLGVSGGGAFGAVAERKWAYDVIHQRTMELLLAGVTMGMIFSALILAIRYFTNPQMLLDMDRWMMGRLDVGGWRTVFSVLPFLVPGMAILLLLARGLDQISFGEELAHGRIARGHHHFADGRAIFHLPAHPQPPPWRVRQLIDFPCQDTFDRSNSAAMWRATLSSLLGPMTAVAQALRPSVALATA